jgi:hypothetical protein
MDRRLSEITPTKNCIHTKNVFSLLDLGVQDESFLRMRKHMDNCKICEKEFNDFKFKSLEVKIHIPKPLIDSETKEVFSREITELFKTFELNQKTLLRKKIKTNIKKIDTFGISFLKTLTSKAMLASYAFGAVLFVVLKKFF